MKAGGFLASMSDTQAFQEGLYCGALDVLSPQTQVP